MVLQNKTNTHTQLITADSAGSRQQAAGSVQCETLRPDEVIVRYIGQTGASSITRLVSRSRLIDEYDTFSQMAGGDIDQGGGHRLNSSPLMEFTQPPTTLRPPQVGLIWQF